MQNTLFKNLTCALTASLAAAALFIAGCEGDKGDRGPAGPAGPGGVSFVNVSSMTTQDQADLNFQGDVQSVTISSPPVVKFRITDNQGRPVTGIGARNSSGQLQNLKFTLAKLIPSQNGSPSRWVSYIVTTASPTPVPTRPTMDREGTLVDNGDGTYTYTFYRDITQVKSIVDASADTDTNRKADLDDLTYDPNLTHRLVIEYGGSILNTSPSIPFKNALNIVYDFIPATGQRVTAANTQREIVDTSYCNQCHILGVTTPHSGRVRTEYCAICHTNQRAYGRPLSTSTNNGFTGSTYVTEENGYREVFGNFMTMVHKIHMGTNLTKSGYNYAGVRFDLVGYPQSPALCRKCHRGDTPQELALTPQGNNWNTMPSRNACGACHDAVNFLTGANHDGGVVQTNDASCTACHTSQAIKQSHAQELLSPLNPDTPAGLTNFTYEVSSATVSGTTATVTFRILANGAPVTFAAAAPSVTAPLTGFTGSPSFLLAYAMPQDGITAPADYNNLGRSAGQPATVSIAQLLSTNNAATIGSMTPSTSGNGSYTATILNAFPAGATMRAVGLQGYFTQTQGLTTPVARHTVAAITPVTGDEVRRVVVDPNKCRNCHEFFEAHGGNRVFTTQLCVTCHNPNLTTSGRTIPDALLAAYNFNALQTSILTSWDAAFATNRTLAGYALTFPETSNNFKDLIHSIHAGSAEGAGMRATPFRDVRFGPGTTSITIVSGSEIEFPNILNNCEACHATGTTSNGQTYKADLPGNLQNRVLPSTEVVRNSTTPATTASLTAARATVPNPQDLVLGPITAACVTCHDTPSAKAHINANGGQLGAGTTGPSYTDMGVPRSTYLSNGGNAAEQCVLCHGTGRIADVVVVHRR